MDDALRIGKSEYFRWHFLTYDISALTRAVLDNSVEYTNVTICSEALEEMVSIISATPEIPAISFDYLETISLERLNVPIFVMRLPPTNIDNELGFNLPGQLAIDGSVLKPGAPSDRQFVIIDGNHRIVRAQMLKITKLSACLFEFDSLSKFFVE